MHSKLRRSALAGTAVLAVALTSCAGSPSEAYMEWMSGNIDRLETALGS
jgi:zinc/manganese transport system substrate-binding protein